MIRPRSDTISGRVLAALVRAPGATVEQLALVVLPPMRRTTPYTSASDRRAFLAARSDHETAARRQVSLALGRLAEAGLVAPPRPAHVPRWYRQSVRRHGRVQALARAADRLDSCGEEPGDLSAVRRELAAVEMRPGWGRVRSGAAADARRSLVEWGVVVAPSQRWATPAGIETVNEWRL